MSIRRPWSQEEDRVLKLLKQNRNVKKWSSIAKIMDFQFNICGRNGKQCRQRYSNHLHAGIVDRKLSLDEEHQLEQINHQMGNKWAVIARHFPGRTANFLKNTLYSKLRKSVRKMNKFLKETRSKEVKQFKLNVVFKVVESNDFKFYGREGHSEDDLKFYAELKERMFRYADQQLSLRKQIKEDKSSYSQQNPMEISSLSLARDLSEFLRKYDQLGRKVKKPKKRYFSQDDIILNSLSNNKICLFGEGQKQLVAFNMQTESKQTEEKFSEEGESEDGEMFLRRGYRERRKKKERKGVEVTQLGKGIEKYQIQSQRGKTPCQTEKSPSLNLPSHPTPSTFSHSLPPPTFQRTISMQSGSVKIANNNRLNQMLCNGFVYQKSKVRNVNLSTNNTWTTSRVSPLLMSPSSSDLDNIFLILCSFADMHFFC